MKHNLRITMIVNINSLDENSVVSSAMAAATFEAEIEWVPMNTESRIVGVLPNSVKEIIVEQVTGGRFVRFAQSLCATEGIPE